MSYQYEFTDACLKKTRDYVGSMLFTYLVGANYKTTGESDTTNGSITPLSGQRGYGILNNKPRLADGYDKNSPSTNYISVSGGKEPWPWYTNARSAWYNGINRTINNDKFNLCQAGGLFNVADPIAQSFFIVGKSVVLTKIDIYFRNKDTSLPVYVELRRNVAGVPGPEVIPFSTCINYPYLIKTSEDASLPTSFIFDGPVYLEEGEYSVIVRSDSLKYEVWVAVTNEIDITTKQKISTQPTLGSFFKSQNLSTWTPDQLTDLKFTLYRAEFDTTDVGYPHFTIHPWEFNTLTLEKDPIEFYPGAKVQRIYAPGHGLKLNDNVNISLNGFTDSRIAFLSDMNKQHLVKAANFDEIIITSNALPLGDITGPTRLGGENIQLVSSHNILFDTIKLEVPFISSLNTVSTGVGDGEAFFKVLDANTKTYTYGFMPINGEVDFDSTKIVLNPSANSSPITDLNPIYTNLRNYDTFTLALPISSNDSYQSPLIDRKKLKIRLIKNLTDNPTFANKHLIPQDIQLIANSSANISISKVNDLNTLATMVFTDSSQISNIYKARDGSYLTVSTANSSGLFRLVSKETVGSNANVVIASLGEGYANVFNFTPNVITDSLLSVTLGTRFIDERAAKGGSAKNKYITKEIKFANPSTSIYLKVDACRPKNTNLKFYYRTKLSGDFIPLADKEFTEFPIVNIPEAKDSNQYFEIATQADSLPPFESVQIKIVFLADTYAGRPPKVKNLRVVSLA